MINKAKIFRVRVPLSWDSTDFCAPARQQRPPHSMLCLIGLILSDSDMQFQVYLCSFRGNLFKLVVDVWKKSINKLCLPGDTSIHYSIHIYTVNIYHVQLWGRVRHISTYLLKAEHVLQQKGNTILRVALKQ
jgi:hypothetical protein